MLRCPSCETPNGLDADDRESVACRRCGCTIPFPSFGDDEIVACYGCLRAGEAALIKDTELGMVSWEQAFDGVTHGVPGLNRGDFEMVHNVDGWVVARLAQETMFELLRLNPRSSILDPQSSILNPPRSRSDAAGVGADVAAVGRSSLARTIWRQREVAGVEILGDGQRVGRVD